MKLFALILVLGMGSFAMAKGGSDGGGGDTVNSDGQRKLLDLVEKDEVHYANLKVSNFDPVLAASLSKKFLDDYDRYSTNLELFDGNYDFSLSFLIALGNLGPVYQRLMAKTGFDVAPLVWIFVDQELDDI